MSSGTDRDDAKVLARLLATFFGRRADSPAALALCSSRYTTGLISRTDNSICLAVGQMSAASLAAPDNTAWPVVSATARALRNTSDSVTPSRAARAASEVRRPQVGGEVLAGDGWHAKS
jgi:hypothetical protein